MSLTHHPEEAAVRVPLEHYMQGHATDDSAHMRQAFMPSAHIESVREGPLTSWTLEEYCKRFKGTPATAAERLTPSTLAVQLPAPKSRWFMAQ